MARGDAVHSTHTTFRDWGYFDSYNIGTDYNDEDLKNMILNSNTILNADSEPNYCFIFLIIIIAFSFYYLLFN